MRFLLLAALCLFTAPAQASTFNVASGGQYEVVGDFDTLGINNGINTYIYGIADLTLRLDVNPGIYDPINGPFYGYNVNIHVNEATLSGCSNSQAQSMWA